MCSSPKGSSLCFRHTKRKEEGLSEYQEYVTMVERASAVYDRIEQEKVEKRLLLARQKPSSDIEKTQGLKDQGNVETGMLSTIKIFLLQAVF